MDMQSWLKLSLLFALSEIPSAHRDLLESFRPRAGNPTELNDFLANVLEHKDDFNFVRQQAKKFQKPKKEVSLEEYSKDIDPLEDQMDFYDDFSNLYRYDSKRHVHNHHNDNKRYRNFVHARPKIHHPRKKSSRHKRTLEDQDYFIEIESQNGNVEVPGEKYPKGSKQKKEAFEDDLIKPVHKTVKSVKGRQLMKKKEDDNLLYVDLGEETRASKDEEESEKFNAKRRYEWIPQRPDIYYPQYASGNQDEPNEDVQNRVQYSRPGYNKVFPDSKYDNFDYYNIKHKSPVDDEVEFERAQTFEIGPRGDEEQYNSANNPQGNNLYSVDEGMEDRIQPFYPSQMVNYPPQRFYPYPNNIQNQPFKIQQHQQDLTYKNLAPQTQKSVSIIDNNPYASSTTSTTDSPGSSTTFDKILTKLKENLSGLESNEPKSIKPFGKGFIEISKSRREDSEAYPPQVADEIRDNEQISRLEMLKKTRRDDNHLDPREEKKIDTMLENTRNSKAISREDISEAERIEERGTSEIEKPDIEQIVPREISEARRDDKMASQEVSDNENEEPPREADVEKREDNDIPGQVVSKLRGEDDDSPRESGILAKNSLHPLRTRASDFDDVVDNSDFEKYQSRQLKFMDEDMLKNTYEYKDDEDGLDGFLTNSRSKRDFLTGLQMDNEDDYASDNLHKKDLNINNTDIKDDTRIRNMEANNTKGTCGNDDNGNKTGGGQIIDNMAHQNEDVTDIEKILQEPKESEGDNNVAEFKSDNTSLINKIERKRARTKKDNRKLTKKIRNAYSKKEKKHPRKIRHSEYYYDNDGSDYDYEELRNVRDTSNDVDLANQILQNKDKILNYQESAKNRNINLYNNLRPQRNFQPQWTSSSKVDDDNLDLEKHVSHNLKKKQEGSESLASAEIPPADAFVDPSAAGHASDVSVAPPETEHTEKNEAMQEFSSTAPLTMPMEFTQRAEVNVNLETKPSTVKAESNMNQLINEKNDPAYEKMIHQMDVENERLAQVVNGHHASSIVSEVYDALRKRQNLKNKFQSGLSRKHANYEGDIDFNLFKINETEDVGEARRLLTQMTKTFNRIVNNQIRRKMCQRLPDDLKEYLHSTLNVKNTMFDVNNKFTPNANQGNFLFAYQEDKPAPAFDGSKIHETLMNLEGLLLNYKSLNHDCKNRAEPVKDYIEKHVKLLRKLVSCPNNMCAGSGNTAKAAKRDTPRDPPYASRRYFSPTPDKDMVQRQLDSLGLGKNHDFIPNFDIDQIVRNKMKSNHKRDTHKHHYKSDKYRKLQLAAERIREKRENERKIGEVFGSKQKRSAAEFDIDYEEPIVYSLG